MSLPSPKRSRRPGAAQARHALLQAAAFAAATLLGWGASAAGLPLAWMIGAMTAAAGFAMAGHPPAFRRARPITLVVLGLALGESFTPQILAWIGANLPVIALCAAATLASGLPMAGLFRRMAGLDRATAFFCAVPGGVVLMAVQARRAGASEPHVTLAQTVRLVLVVMIYAVLIALVAPGHAAALPDVAPPALTDLPAMALLLAAGVGAALLARRLNVPNPWMLAPCVMTIALIGLGATPPPLPHAMVTLCQIVLGLTLGAQMTPDFLRGSGRLLRASVVSTLALSAIAAPASLLVAHLAGYGPVDALLGMSPGGMPEMTVAARSIGAAVPLVLSFHLARILICNLLLEPFWRLTRRELPAE